MDLFTLFRLNLNKRTRRLEGVDIGLVLSKMSHSARKYLPRRKETIMGARATIRVIHPTSDTPIHLYTHWRGNDITEILAEGIPAAAARARA